MSRRSTSNDTNLSTYPSYICLAVSCFCYVFTWAQEKQIVANNILQSPFTWHSWQMRVSV